MRADEGSRLIVLDPFDAMKAGRRRVEGAEGEVHFRGARLASPDPIRRPTSPRREVTQKETPVDVGPRGGNESIKALGGSARFRSFIHSFISSIHPLHCIHCFIVMFIIITAGRIAVLDPHATRVPLRSTWRRRRRRRRLVARRPLRHTCGASIRRVNLDVLTSSRLIS